MEQNLAEGLVDALRAAGVNFITYLPETRLSEIIPILQSDSSFHMVPVGSEAEGVSIAAGAALGGKIVASYMEGTGVYVSCYNILTVGVRYGVPMLLLVSYVGSLRGPQEQFPLRSERHQTDSTARSAGCSVSGDPQWRRP